jgi:ammonia channel protein AmtB
MEAKMATAKIITLAVHNILRWAIVLLALYALLRTVGGWIRKSNWNNSVQKALTYFSISIDIQLLVGFLLYFVFSQLTKIAFQDFGTAMGNPTIRFFAIEHVFIMLLGLVFAHLSSAIGKKDLEDQIKFRRASIFLILSILLIIAGIPWVSRPLIPMI